MDTQTYIEVITLVHAQHPTNGKTRCGRNLHNDTISRSMRSPKKRVVVSEEPFVPHAPGTCQMCSERVRFEESLS